MGVFLKFEEEDVALLSFMFSEKTKIHWCFKYIVSWVVYTELDNVDERIYTRSFTNTTTMI